MINALFDRECPNCHGKNMMLYKENQILRCECCGKFFCQKCFNEVAVTELELKDNKIPRITTIERSHHIC